MPFLQPTFKFLDQVLSSLFQPECLVCGKSSGASSLCLQCNPILPITQVCCARCGHPITQEMDRCGRCLKKKLFFLARTGSSLWLSESARKCLHLVKYQYHFELLGLFKEAFLRNSPSYIPMDTTVVPVPIHFYRFLSRSFNQAEILAGWMAKHLNLKFEAEGLVKRQMTSPQSTLSKKERMSNLRSSFFWSPKLKVPQTVLLIDDVYTTGATLNECAKTFIRAGCYEVYAWSLFRTPEKRLNF